MPASRQIALSDNESDRIVGLIRPDFAKYATRYDERKYPAAEYEYLLSAFQKPGKVCKSDICRALVWKFGHFGKLRIPDRHEKLVLFVHGRWHAEKPGVDVTDPCLSSTLGGSGADFDNLVAASGGTRYITFAFLKHLLRPDEVPIIDQHNFRAMNHYCRAVRPDWQTRSKPGKHGDLLALSTFLSTIMSRWKKIHPSTAPPERALDCFLMMYGKALKPRKKRRQPRSPITAVA
jgi:hypothetical protein